GTVAEDRAVHATAPGWTLELLRR
ncbi:MAG: hypothetical protein QOJ12_698, partial [Thermoleophilales bacterium]|nr:hypothetical protein [Thermoleophilales bacterium]